MIEIREVGARAFTQSVVGIEPGHVFRWNDNLYLRLDDSRYYDRCSGRVFAVALTSDHHTPAVCIARFANHVQVNPVNTKRIVVEIEE